MAQQKKPRGRQFRAARAEKDPLVAHFGEVSFTFPSVWPAATWVEFVIRREEGNVSNRWLYEAVLGDQYEAVVASLDREEIEDLTELLLSVYTGQLSVDDWNRGATATEEEPDEAPFVAEEESTSAGST